MDKDSIQSISEAYRSMHEASPDRRTKKFKKKLDKLDRMVNDLMLDVEQMEGLNDSEQLNDETYKKYIRTSDKMRQAIKEMQNYV